MVERVVCNVLEFFMSDVGVVVFWFFVLVVFFCLDGFSFNFFIVVFKDLVLSFLLFGRYLVIEIFFLLILVIL